MLNVDIAKHWLNMGKTHYL